MDDFKALERPKVLRFMKAAMEWDDLQIEVATQMLNWIADGVNRQEVERSGVELYKALKEGGLDNESSTKR